MVVYRSSRHRSRPLHASQVDQNLASRYRLVDMRQTILAVVMIILSILMCVAVLLQQRSSGLGMAFGGDGNVFRTKRGLEKGLFYATIALSVLFFGVAILNLIVG